MMLLNFIGEMPPVVHIRRAPVFLKPFFSARPRREPVLLGVLEDDLAVAGRPGPGEEVGVAAVTGDGLRRDAAPVAPAGGQAVLLAVRVGEGAEVARRAARRHRVAPQRVLLAQ